MGPTTVNEETQTTGILLTQADLDSIKQDKRLTDLGAVWLEHMLREQSNKMMSATPTWACCGDCGKKGEGQPPGFRSGTQVAITKEKGLTITHAMLPVCGADACSTAVDKLLLDPAPADTSVQCAGCNAFPPPGVTFQRCGKCRSRAYCSTACRDTDWPTHRRACKKQ